MLLPFLFCVISLIIFLIFSGKQRSALCSFVSKLEDCGCIARNRIHELEFAEQGTYLLIITSRYLLLIMVELAFVCKRQEGIALKQFEAFYRQIIMTRGYKL